MFWKRLAFAIVSGVGVVALLILLQMAKPAPMTGAVPDRLAFTESELLAEGEVTGEQRTSAPPTAGLSSTPASATLDASPADPASKLPPSVTLRAEITTTTASTTTTRATWNSSLPVTTRSDETTTAPSTSPSSNTTDRSASTTTHPSSSHTSVTSTENNPGDSDGVKLVYYNAFSSGALDKENWDRYHSPGHAGWGLRRPSAISVVPMAGTLGGHALQIRASMGTGDEAGMLVSGGMMLRGHEQRYGRYTVRIRVDADPAEVTSGVALLWPASGKWPAGGEIDFFEGWGNRSTRTPVESHLHWADAAGNDTTADATHSVAGTNWHTYVLDWRPGEVSVSVDGGTPVILSSEHNEIPQGSMNLAIQLDGFDAPHAQGQQPSLTQPVRLQVDWIRVEAYD